MKFAQIGFPKSEQQNYFRSIHKHYNIRHSCAWDDSVSTKRGVTDYL